MDPKAEHKLHSSESPLSSQLRTCNSKIERMKSAPFDAQTWYLAANNANKRKMHSTPIPEHAQTQIRFKLTRGFTNQAGNVSP